ncbi:hypothetical protein QVD99_003976 [Batrachochytrium dendrobatidis]|uniref:Peptidase A1 domain-containing protein n=1 Tax=Batrachochytrium dendrobatidis (strain JEL423) TaxID=403673 RepID=A0A177WEE4_BATDL|nr:hypothetical protein QVD99_003976 [Batrachochytrium dendrobatidis]OAJ38112.1 hypothetical protein BDEG_22072 [Batrachochytrium dendrobatidis JEL423]
MLITLEFILLALQAVAAIQIPLESPNGITSQPSNRLSKRSPVKLSGDIGRCFKIKVNVDGVNLALQVDSAFSDIIVPLSSSSNNVGLASESISSEKPVNINYNDDEYNGVTSTATVTIPGTGIAGVNLPVLAIQKQSASLVGIGGKLGQGIFGFGHSLFSKHYSQFTAMDILYNDGVIPNNEIGLQLCPYGAALKSSINIGNTDVTTKCGTDGKSVAWVQSPKNNQFSVNIKSILVNDKSVELPEEFQQVVEDGRTLYSSVETCYMYMCFPEMVVYVLINSILDSDAITVKTMFKNDHFSKRKIKKKLQKNHLMSKSKYSVDWDKMPTLSIVMFSQAPVTDDNRDSVVTITLGPKDYMQIIDSEDFMFTVTACPNDYANLGTSFMTRLRLTFDLQNQRIGFGPGCGCETATDGYPTISNGDQVLWSPSQLPEQPSTSGSDGTSTPKKSFWRLGSTRHGSKQAKFNYEKFDG